MGLAYLLAVIAIALLIGSLVACTSITQFNCAEILQPLAVFQRSQQSM